MYSIQVRKAMGLSVPEDEDSPSPPPQQSADILEWQARMLAQEAAEREAEEAAERGGGSPRAGSSAGGEEWGTGQGGRAGVPRRGARPW